MTEPKPNLLIERTILAHETGLEAVEGFAMFTIKQIDLRSTGTAADEGRLRGTAANRALPLEQRTLRRASESPVDRDRKVIPFRSNAAPTRTLGLQSGDTNCASTSSTFGRASMPRGTGTQRPMLARRMPKNPSRANSETTKPQPKLTMTTVIVWW
jgi:hypothetical protein